jgi:phage FluMu gp28-like protein
MRYHRKWGDAINTVFPGLIDFSGWTTERARYPGGDVLIFSSDPDAFRGMEGDPTLDEVAFHERQPELYAASQSRIQWLPDGQVSMISSHSHPDTEFARWEAEALRGKSHWSWHRTTLLDAVAQGLAAKVPGPHTALPPAERDKAFVESIRRTCNTEEDFLREYLCKPAALSAAVRAEDYDACVLGPVPDTLTIERRYGDLYVGIDCGRANDSTVVWVLEQSPRPDSGGMYCYRTVCVKVIERTPFGQQFEMIAPLLRHPAICKGYIDQGSQGYVLAEAVFFDTGEVIEKFGFSLPRKAAMASRVRAFTQTHRVSFPANDDKTRASVLCVRAEKTPGGGIKWEGSTSFDHGDRFWALALALHAAEEGRGRAGVYIPGAGPAATPQLTGAA